MRKFKTVTLFPALFVILCAGLAVLLLGIAPAFAVAPAPAVQTPLRPTKIPQFKQPLPVLDPAGLTGVPVVINPDLSAKTAVELSICEFQTEILPPGTLGKNTAAPLTSVWGYNIGSNTCLLPTPPVGAGPRSYLGPVVIAERHQPTTMTYWNKLPNASAAKVMAYATSTDPTLIWGDPLSLNTAPPPINFNDPVGTADPEQNWCWKAAQAFVPGVTLGMPAPCLNNYGFRGPQALPPNAPQTYAAPVPAAVHIHGGEVPSVLDGGPDAWWTGNGIYGHGYYSKGGIGDAALGMAIYRYPNGQEAAPIWFHDHMLGATRLNVYAGIAGGYVITEPASTLAAGLHPLGLSDTTWTPEPESGQTQNDRPLTELVIPLIIQDRMFDTTGQLYFPAAGINPEHPFWVPEFVGDVIVVNGKAWPYLNVAPKRYKFIFLNGSNARAYELYLMSKTTGLKGPWMWVIGNDQGYLDTAQPINPNVKPNDKLIMMPGERYEVVIDFTGLAAGEVIEMRNTARTPYVGRAPVNGNTTGKIMQFNVNLPAVVDNSFDPAKAPTVRATPMVRLVDVNLATVPPISAPAGGVTVHKTRRLTLNEVIGAGGPLEVLVNNTLYDGTKREIYYSDFTPITTMNYNTTLYSELPYEGETELWEIVNLTADAHPMHPHLVAFQILNRQGLDVLAYTAAYNTAYVSAGMVNPATGLPLEGYGPPLNYNSSGVTGCGATAPGRYNPNDPNDPANLYMGLNPTCVLGGNPDPALIPGALLGAPVAPMPQEIGWKDTVQALPNMVTRILVRFAKADLPANTPTASAGYDFSPNHGHGYVWHCHIVDHEDNEMMRPFTVMENTAYPHPYVQGVQY